MQRAIVVLACAPLALGHVPRPLAFSLKTATTDASTLLVDKVNEANEKYGLGKKIAPFRDAIFAVGSSLGLPFPGVWHMRKKHRKGGGAIYGKKRRADKKDTSETAETIQVWWFHREWVRARRLSPVPRAGDLIVILCHRRRSISNSSSRVRSRGGNQARRPSF